MRPAPPFWVGAARGRVVLATERGWVEQVLAGEGDAWLSDAVAPFVATHLLVAQRPDGSLRWDVRPASGQVWQIDMVDGDGQPLTPRGYSTLAGW